MKFLLIMIPIWLIVLGGLGFAFWKNRQMLSGLDEKEVPKSADERFRSVTTTQELLPFEEITGGIIRLDGHHYRSVVEVFGIPMNTKSEAERQGVLVVYKETLEALKIPFQRLTANVRLNPQVVIDQIQERQGKQPTEGLLGYSQALADFVRAWSDEKAPSSHRNYYILAYDYDLKAHMDPLTADQIEAEAKLLLDEAAMGLISGLDRSRIKATRLDSAAVAQLMFQVFNRDRAKHIDIGRAVVSDRSNSLFATADL